MSKPDSIMFFIRVIDSNDCQNSFVVRCVLLKSISFVENFANSLRPKHLNNMHLSVIWVFSSLRIFVKFDVNKSFYKLVHK